MIRLFSSIGIVTVVAAVFLSQPMTPAAQARPLRLFLIGNSFSVNATTHLPQMAKEGGHDLTIGRAEAAGASLKMHWEAIEKNDANPADPKGKPYRGKALRELLGNDTWDVVTLQQGSMSSGNADSYRPYAQKLRDWVKKLQPQAEVVVHQTWPYRSDAPQFSIIDSTGKHAASNREMWEKLLVAYHSIAADLGARLIPTGEAFWRITSDARWQYKKDANYDFANPVYPNLPDQTNSLNEGYRWENKTKLSIDANHANEAGKYLGGLVWYGFLFGESPEKVTFAPRSLPADFAAALRQAAAQALGMAPQAAAAQTGTATTNTGTK